jgi:hypothetical protein
MHQKRHTITAIAVGLAVAVMAPIGSAKALPQGKVTIPEWLTRIQYPGTSSEPTVYLAGSITIPNWLARIQHPGTSSEPTVYVTGRSSSRAPALELKNGDIKIPARLANTQYPGTSSEPTVLMNNIQGAGPVPDGFDLFSALIGAGGSLGIAAASAGSLMAVRKRRTLTHV